MATGNVYEVIYTKHFRKQLAKSPREIQDAVDSALGEISRNPFHHANIKELKGALKGFYRYRIGGYRLVYHVDKEKIMVIAVDIAPRGDVYK